MKNYILRWKYYKKKKSKNIELNDVLTLFSSPLALNFNSHLHLSRSRRILPLTIIKFLSNEFSIRFSLAFSLSRQIILLLSSSPPSSNRKHDDPPGGRVGGCQWRVRLRVRLFLLTKIFPRRTPWSTLHNSRHLRLACVHRWRFTSSPSVEERDFFFPSPIRRNLASLGQYSPISGDGRVAILHRTTRLLPLLCEGSLRELSNERFSPRFEHVD